MTPDYSVYGISPRQISRPRKKKTEDNKGAERNSLMIKTHQDKKQSSN